LAGKHAGDYANKVRKDKNCGGEAVLKGRGLIRKELIDAVAERLKPHGFIARKEDHAFHREQGEVRVSFFLPYVPRPNGVNFTASAGVRFHKLEELKDRFTPPHPLDIKDGNLARSTLGSDLGSHLRGLWQKSWTVTSREAVPKIADKIVAYLLKKGMPFLDKYSNPQTAFAALSKDDAEAIDLRPFDDDRAKSAIGLAYLLFGSDRAREVAARKIDYLRSRRHSDAAEQAAQVEAWVQRLLTNAEPPERRSDNPL
jgi:hypothetical protein